MFGLIELIMSNCLFFALHLERNVAFPKPLNSKEEKECFIKMEQGDERAKSKLIEHNLRLVAHIVKKYNANIYEQEDLISIGTIGLIKAVNTFNYKKGTRFATYASKCVENEILMNFRSKKKSNGDIYFDEPIETDKDGNQLTLMDIISSSDEVLDLVDSKIKYKQVYRYINDTLDDRERDIIKLRYGLYGITPLTQREVAKKFDISRSYVSRIESKALKKLKQRFDESKNFNE